MLTIEADLPISISNRDQTPLSAAANLQTIRSLNLLALGGRSDTGDTTLAEGNHEIARLEAKVDILISMVGSLVAEKSLLPPVHPVTFNAESVTVDFDGSYAVDQPVVVTFYPHPELPRPLAFAAVVSSIVPGTTSSLSHLRLTLKSIDPVVRDEFERYIFLRHRREHSVNSMQ